MKKIYVLMMLGSLLLTVGVLSRAYAYPQLAVIPADTDATVIARSVEGTPTTYFSIAEMAEVTGSLTNVTRVVAQPEDTAAASRETGRDVVAFETYVCSDPTDLDYPGGGADCRANPLPLSGEQSHYAVDAQTGELVSWSGGRTRSGGELIQDVPFAGYVIKLPFNTQSKSYEFWNATLRETVSADYVGETEVAGVRALEFRVDVAPTVVGELDLPGSLLGRDEASVTTDRVFSSYGTVLVEPETGLIIGGTSALDSYAELDGERVLTITQGEFAVSGEDVAKGAVDAKETAAGLYLLRVIAPLSAGAAGVLLLLLAGILAWRRHRHGGRAGSISGAPEGRDRRSLVEA